ncbi:hypothetical protein BG003_011506 [Podila horticola]|nr:hypothetical protein BG003_011506 [Podila horticola]
MTGHGNIAYPLLERVRAEMAEILQILVTYTSQGSINLHSLPSFIACYRVRGDIRGTVTALRQRYHVLQDQEYRLVLANLTGTDAEQFLKGIRLVIQQIEKVMHSYHASEPPLQAIPRCLVTCYSKVGNVVHAAPLLQRYEALKAQEFEICLADMKGASLDLQDLFAQSQRTDQPASVSGFQASSSSPSSIHSVVAPDSTFQPLTSTNMELPVNDHLPSFEESQNKPGQVTFEGLQNHYHMLEEQEAAMVLASNDDQPIHRHLLRTKKLIDLIEKVLQKNRVSHFYPMTLPKCLLSCHAKNIRVDGKAIQKRYLRLKDFIGIQNCSAGYAESRVCPGSNGACRLRLRISSNNNSAHN